MSDKQSMIISDADGVSMANQGLAPSEEFRQAALEAAAAEMGGRPTRLTCNPRKTVFEIGDEAMGNEITCVIAASQHAYVYYEKTFDPTVSAPPDCVAFSLNGANMRPAAWVSRPQSEHCDDCPKYKWGSSPNGKGGKACKERRRLVLVPGDSVGADNPPMFFLNVPVTSVSFFKTYVNAMSLLKRCPTYGLVTRIKMLEDATNQYRLSFTFDSLVPEQWARHVNAAAVKELQRAETEPPAGLSEEPTGTQESVSKTPRKF